MRIDHDAHTHIGRRLNNEDAVLAMPDVGFFAVADGMGGYEGGEVASRTALASLQNYFELLGDTGLGLARSEELAMERMALAVRIADREVTRRAVGVLSKMGTTVACLVTQGERAVLAHVGDSRVYRLREGQLDALTRDHSLYCAMESAGHAAMPSRERFRLSNVITQALGGQGHPARPDLSVVDVMPGDRFLLCTDGLSDVLDEESLAWLMTRTIDAAEHLVRAAYDAGGRDNITAMVVTAS